MKYPKITKTDLIQGLKKWEEEQKNRKYPYITAKDIWDAEWKELLKGVEE